MIPQTFHQVWLGTRAMAPEFLEWADSWRDFNPDWELILWAENPGLFDQAPIRPWHTVRPLPTLWTAPLVREVARYVGEAQRLAAASDIIRYELVARFGGVYLDTDVECLQPIGDLLDGVRLFNAAEFGANVGNFCFGAEKMHPAMVRAVFQLFRDFETERAAVVDGRVAASRRGLRGRRPTRPRGPWLRRLIPGYREHREWRLHSAVLLTGPAYLCRQLEQHPDYVFFPEAVFNPLSAFADYRQVTSWPETAIANHHFFGTWYTRKKEQPPAEFLFGSTPKRNFTGPADEA